MRCFQPFSKIFWKQGKKGPIRRGNIAIGLVVQFFIQPNPAPPLNKLLLEVSSGDKSHKTMLITSTKTARKLLLFLKWMVQKEGKLACYWEPKVANIEETERNKVKEHRIHHPIILMEQLYMSCHDQTVGKITNSPIPDSINSQPNFKTQF